MAVTLCLPERSVVMAAAARTDGQPAPATTPGAAPHSAAAARLRTIQSEYAALRKQDAQEWEARALKRDARLFEAVLRELEGPGTGTPGWAGPEVPGTGTPGWAGPLAGGDAASSLSPACTPGPFNIGDLRTSGHTPERTPHTPEHNQRTPVRGSALFLSPAGSRSSGERARLEKDERRCGYIYILEAPVEVVVNVRVGHDARGHETLGPDLVYRLVKIGKAGGEKSKVAALTRSAGSGLGRVNEFLDVWALPQKLKETGSTASAELMATLLDERLSDVLVAAHFYKAVDGAPPAHGAKTFSKALGDRERLCTSCHTRAVYCQRLARDVPCLHRLTTAAGAGGCLCSTDATQWHALFPMLPCLTD